MACVEGFGQRDRVSDLTGEPHARYRVRRGAAVANLTAKTPSPSALEVLGVTKQVAEAEECLGGDPGRPDFGRT
jgi:hypothetical protein